MFGLKFDNGVSRLGVSSKAGLSHHSNSQHLQPSLPEFAPWQAQRGNGTVHLELR